MVDAGGILYPADGLERLRERAAGETSREYPHSDYAMLDVADQRRARREYIAYGTGPYAAVAAFCEEFEGRMRA